jgi:hypothetical protein
MRSPAQHAFSAVRMQASDAKEGGVARRKPDRGWYRRASVSDIGPRLSKFHSAVGNLRYNVGRNLFEELVKEFTNLIVPAVICSEVRLACTTEAFLS